MIRFCRWAMLLSAVVVALGVGSSRAEPLPFFSSGEEARFRAAELLYRQRQYPRAAEAYQQILRKYRRGRYQKQIVSRLFKIANFWLEDSWDRMKAASDFTSPDWLLWVYPCDKYDEILPSTRDIFEKALLIRQVFHWDEAKPFIGEERRAVELLRLVCKVDPKGPFTDKALFCMGHVAWSRADYHEADKCFSRLHKRFPKSKYDPFTVELAIKAKLITVGDEPENERRLIRQAYKLIREALHRSDFPDDKKRMMLILLSLINTNKANRAFKLAEKRVMAGQLVQGYRRYLRIRLDYPGTYTADMATQRLMELRLKIPESKLKRPPQRLDEDAAEPIMTRMR